MAHDKNLRQELQLQQVELLQKRYNRDKSKLIAAHEQQAQEFKESWDKFMTAIEQKVQDRTSEVEEAHKQQLVMIEQSLSEENSNTNKQHSSNTDPMSCFFNETNLIEDLKNMIV